MRIVLCGVRFGLGLAELDVSFDRVYLLFRKRNKRDPSLMHGAWSSDYLHAGRSQKHCQSAGVCLLPHERRNGVETCADFDLKATIIQKSSRR